MENNNVKTVNAAAIWEAPEALPVREVSMAALEYVQGEEITIPAYQRGDVWDGAADKRLADTVLRGLPLPNIILVEVIDQGRRLLLLVDGLQRRLSLGRLYYGLTAIVDDPEASPEAREEARLKLEYLGRYAIRATVVTATVQEAALLFARLNAGRPLKAAERGRAALPDTVLQGLKPWEEWYTQAMGGASRIGGTTVIAAAMTLAAAHIAAPGKATSSGATAARQLAAYKGVLPAPDGKALGIILEGIKSLAPGAKTGGAWALAPARLIPIYLAVRGGDVTTAAGVKYTLTHLLDREEDAAAVRDSSPGPKATSARLAAIKRVIARRGGGKAPAAMTPAEAESEAVIAAALTERGELV